MDGLVILNQYTEFSSISRICFVSAILLFGIRLILVVCYSTIDKSSKIAGFAAICLVVGLLLVLLGFRVPKDIYYKAFANETITFDEITNHYRIVNVEGKLMTLEEIKDDG